MDLDLGPEVRLKVHLGLGQRSFMRSILQGLGLNEDRTSTLEIKFQQG
jgi:ATP phosphoribosyltransferase regulatory subunit HisZ